MKKGTPGRAPSQLRMVNLPDEGTTERMRKDTTTEVTKGGNVVNG